MNQKTAQGQRLIDQAKTAVENFINKVRCRDPSARTDQYVLITTQEDGTGIRVGLKDNQMTFWQELRNVQAHGLSNLGLAIQVAFDLINCDRWENELDTIGRGRLPWMIKPTSIIVFTDGGKLTSQGNIKNELVLPGSTLPATHLKPYVEPFRWDQRVFSLTLKMNGCDDEGKQMAAAQADHLAPLCDVTGGRNHTVTSPKALMDSLHAIGARMASSSGTGVMVAFERIVESNKSGRPELNGNETSKQWHNTRSMIFVRQNYKTGNFTGFWPIPEAFWPDPNENACPARKATPTLKFSCQDTHPKCLSNFAFDKLELESSPLTVAMLERKRPDLCWQVFVENSGKFGGIGKPIGYLKPNSQNTMVNLFIHPYNYEEALCLIEDLFRSNMSPTPIWRKQWDEYLANIPNYYISHFRKALVQARAPAGIIQDAFDIKLNNTISQDLKKLKFKLRNESERLKELIAKNRLEAPDKTIQVRPVGGDIQTEFAQFDMMNQQRNIRKRPYLEAFDVDRKSILAQLNRMRISFAQSLKSGRPIHKEHVLHEQIISQMGNYQEYLKKSVVPLRDPHADPDMPKQKGPTFGNPWKRDNKSALIDVDGIGDVDGLNVPNNNPNRKRKGKRTEAKKKNVCYGTLSRFKKNDSDSSMESSDTESDHSDSEMKIDESYNSFKHHNGFANHEHTNGHHHHHHHHHHNNRLVATTDSENRHNSNNDKVYNDVQKAIKNYGFHPRKLYRRLCELETENEDDVRHHIRKLMVDAIRFKRPELLSMLQGYQDVALSQQETTKTATSEPQLPRIL